MAAPKLEHFCDLTVELGPIRELGDGRGGKRRIIPILAGEVRGERVRGRVLNVGADWQTVFTDGLAQLDTRYAFETDDGATIEIINFGYRHGPPEVMAALARGEEIDPERYYMRTHARLEAGDPRYQWVNRLLFVGSGRRNPTSVEIALYQVL